MAHKKKNPVSGRAITSKNKSQRSKPFMKKPFQEIWMVSRKSPEKTIEKRIIGEGLTFDDLLLVPQRSDTLPQDVDISSRITRKIKLTIPLVSAAMDTVTDSKLAIAIAQEGGIGIIHRNINIERQAKEVERVKRSEAGIITNPICLSPEASIATARNLMKEHNISGIPITIGKRLVGIITARDLRLQEDDSRKIDEVMTKDLVTAKPGVTLDEAKRLLSLHKIEKLLIVDDEFNLCGLITMKDIYKQEQRPNACKDSQGRLVVGAAVGINDYERVSALIKRGVDLIVIDTAHGHSKGVIQTLKGIKDRFSIDVVAGNIATKDAVKDLVKAGADALKVGIGPGSICTTRVITGVGVPQLTAIYDVKEAAKKYDIPVIADGGIRNSGDITKAIAIGADCVMIGNLFAGAAEAPGETIIYKGRSYKAYRGMGSLGAYSQLISDRYAVIQGKKFVPEGVEGMVPFRGTLSNIIFQLIGGLKSGMGYCGARTIRDLQEKARFIKVTGSSLREGHPHNVIITKEAPNYTTEAHLQEEIEKF
jgi:IMP dehydrogenase